MLEGESESGMNFLVGGKSAGGGEGMGGGKNERIGEVLAVFDKAAPSVATNEGASGGDSGFLKVAERETGLIPGVEAKDGKLHEAEEGFVDGHIAGGGSGGVKKEAGGHVLKMGTRGGAGKSCHQRGVC